MGSTPAKIAWDAIGVRIRGLGSSCDSLYASMASYSDDSGVITRYLIPEANACFELVKTFLEKYRSQLPGEVTGQIRAFVTEREALFESGVAGGGLDIRLVALRPRVGALQTVSEAVAHGLSDPVAYLETVANRAFLHLQRRIVVETGFRAQWESAYESGEVNLEQLGVHLLWHGVWAFKANATGARTDLVMGDVIDNPVPIQRAGCGLVLTEWKRAGSSRSGSRPMPISAPMSPTGAWSRR